MSRGEYTCMKEKKKNTRCTRGSPKMPTSMGNDHFLE